LIDQWGGQTPPADPNWEYTDQIRKREAEQKQWGKAPRGCDLFLVDGQVVAFDRLLYGPRQYWVGRYFAQPFLPAGTETVDVRASNEQLVRLGPGSAGQNRLKWDIRTDVQPRAVAVCSNAMLVAGGRLSQDEVVSEPVLKARSLDDGSPLWTQPLPAAADWWSLATDHAGRVFVTLQDGSVVCLRPKQGS